jgi:hypothetical protein
MVQLIRKTIHAKPTFFFASRNGVTELTKLKSIQQHPITNHTAWSMPGGVMAKI